MLQIDKRISNNLKFEASIHGCDISSHIDETSAAGPAQTKIDDQKRAAIKKRLEERRVQKRSEALEKSGELDG